MKRILITLMCTSSICYAANEPYDPNLHGVIMLSHPNKAFVKSPEYINSDEERYVRFLLNVQNKAKREITQFALTKDVSDTHLKNSYKNIKLSIPFTNLKEINNIDGYAPIGSYENGWTGIKVFFHDNEIGACAYSKVKIISIQLDKEDTEYHVNNKPSFKVINGNYEGGFINNVTWYTDKKSYVFQEQIDCANRKLDRNILDKLVVLANKIDLE